jgi:DNA-binding MarR family transcriptional regulator
MAVKQEIKNQFSTSMLHFVSAVKSESEQCCIICGGFNEKELLILGFIGHRKDVIMSDIAENMKAPLSTLTSIVDKLVEKKYLLRAHSEEDRRVVNVTLAPKGKEAYKIFTDRRNSMTEKILSQFSVNERNNLIDYLGRISNTLKSVE